jgi:hypothetical protein
MNAQNFLNSVVALPMYIAIGNTLPWATEPTPPAIPNEESLDYKYWKNIIGMKRIKPINVSLDIKNRIWTTGTVYDEYRHNYSPTNPSHTGATTLENATFFVVSGTNVYKCISNNYNAASTVAPSGTLVDTFTTADGYIWKYMGTVNVSSFAYTPIYIDSNVVSAAVIGGLSNIRKINGGSGYTTANVQITGDGRGAQGYATLSGGSITGLFLSSVGQGYTYANVQITGDGIGATAEAILSPENGHGANAYLELFANTIQVNMTLTPADSIYFTSDNKYRAISIINNPLLWGTRLPAKNDYYDCTYNIVLSSAPADFQLGEKVTGSTSLAQGYVVEWNSSTKTLRIAQNETTGNGVFKIETVLGSTSGASGLVSSTLNPDIQLYTGEMVYMDAIAPITRHAMQTDSINIFINF